MSAGIGLVLACYASLLTGLCIGILIASRPRRRDHCPDSPDDINWSKPESGFETKSRIFRFPPER